MFDLNPNTVRTWERRYKFPSPVRSSGGHRAYTQSDIETIARIVALMNSGIAPADAIRQVTDAATKHQPTRAATSMVAYETEILKALQEQDSAQLIKITRTALKELSYASFITSLAFPMLVQLGKNWEETGQGVAMEHTFTHLITGIIYEQAQTLTFPDGVPTVTFACVPDELHQLPLLHLCNLAAEQKIARPLILTAGLPMDEIIDASRRGGASLIVLSATVVPSSADTRKWVARCINAGWANRVVLTGPGFTRSRVYAEYPVRAAAGNFIQAVEVVKELLRQI